MATERLGLYKPDYLTDEWEYFINEMSNNFQKLDDAYWEKKELFPTSGFHLMGEIKQSATPTIGGYLGWVNIRSGQSAPVWIKQKVYQSGDLIVPERDNGHYYICTQSGTSGLTEPIFPVSNNGTVKDSRGSNGWISNHTYSVNDIVVPSIDNGRYYICIQGGLSGNSEPVWQTIEGSTTYDGNISWHGFRIATWQESGVSAHFRPFGKIE